MTDAERKSKLSFAIFWAMRERRVSAPKLAKAIKRSDDTVRRWLDPDGSAPSALDLAPLAKALGVKVTYFTHPPDLPSYPFHDFESDEPPDLSPLESGAQEGLRRDQQRLATEARPRPVPLPVRRPRGTARERA